METLEELKNIYNVINKTKAENIVEIKISEHSSIADYFIVASATSTTAVKAIADYLEKELLKMKMHVLRSDGYNDGNWIVLDFGSIIVHLFTKEVREFYNIEKLWNKGNNLNEILETINAVI